jgi:transposase-like protein
MYIMKSDGEPSRRHQDRALKAKLVKLSLQPGASASAIAREHGINANLLFTWPGEFPVRNCDCVALSTKTACATSCARCARVHDRPVAQRAPAPAAADSLLT